MFGTGPACTHADIAPRFSVNTSSKQRMGAFFFFFLTIQGVLFIFLLNVPLPLGRLCPRLDLFAEECDEGQSRPGPAVFSNASARGRAIGQH